MKRIFKWMGIVVGVCAAGAVTYEVVQSVRTSLKSSLGRAEAIAGKTQDMIAETQGALHDAKQAI